MPFYEYQCGDCGHRLEVLQKISDEPLVFCPQCNAASLKKLISASAFRLKGSGWYETDFKNGDQKKEKSTNGKTASPGSSDAGSSAKDSSASDKPDKNTDKKSDKNTDKKTDKQPSNSGSDKGVSTSATT